MRTRIVAALVVAASFALACADVQENGVTTPDMSPRLALITVPACDAAANRDVKAQQLALFPKTHIKSVQARWDTVVTSCSPTNANAANAALMKYVAHIISLYPANVLTPKGAQKEASFLGHIDLVFPYVGYTSPDVPGGSSGPLQAGILGVILKGGGELTKVTFGAIKLDSQVATGDQRGHLFAMYPTNASCLSVDNLDELGTNECVEVRAFPTVSPVFSPKIQVGVCLPDNLGGITRALGHEVNSKTEIAGRLAYPSNCHVAGAAGSWSGGFGEVARRLAWIGKRTLGISTAYASHAGLGGIGGTMSPFGPVDVQIFAASFNHAAGTAAPDTGNAAKFTFTDSVSAPGSILVQASLGEYTGPLLVMSQGGGNCNNCGGLLVQANLYSASGAAADDGVYEVNWTSVQASPSVKGAPFVLRDELNRELARLTYVTTASAGNQLYYNDTILVGTWTRNVPQNFMIRVNLDDNNTSLLIGGNPVTNATNRTFVNPAVTTFARLVADFRGIDSGVMGWDEIGVQRRNDH